MNLDDKTFLRELGDHLRELRVAQNLTQEEVGRKCRLDRTFIGSVERGERNISVLNLRKVAKALRSSIESVVKGLT